MIRSLTAVGMLVLIAGCATAEPERLPMADACLITGDWRIPVSVELARTPKQRSKGLMGRTSLPPDSGMLFIYQRPRDPDYGFWMHQTLIPLDIAYLNEEGVIGAIRHMTPCPSKRGSECPSYPAGVSFSLALEMNEGFFERHDIGVGDRLELNAARCQAAG